METYKKILTDIGIDVSVLEAKSYEWQCMECGKKFNKKIGPRTFEIKCPKCGSTDIDLYVEGGYRESKEVGNMKSLEEGRTWNVSNSEAFGS